MKITSIKENRDIETNELQGYLLNNSIHIPSFECRYKKDIEKYLSNNGVITSAFTNEEREDYLKNSFTKNIESFADTKTDEAEAKVAEKTKVTTNQRRRYESKYALAVRYLDTQTDEDKDKLLQIDKQVKLDDATDVANLLIKLHNDWIKALDNYNLLIDYFRIAFTKDVEDNFTLENKEVFEYKFELLKKLTIDATYEDIDNIIAITEIPESYTNA